MTSAPELDVATMYRFAIQLAYREDPGTFREYAMRALRYQLEDRKWLSVACFYFSCAAYAFAVAGPWWIALPCLPLSLVGANYARQARALRLPWAKPVVQEVGAVLYTPPPALKPTDAV